MLKKIVIILTLILWPLNLISKDGFPTFQIPETIFTKDYEAEQLVLRNIHLYPNPLFARVFQNKGRIYFNKFAGNFFALTDPNYYFFASHPEPLFGYKNLFKFPFFAIVPFLIGIFNIEKYKYRKILFVFFLTIIPLLSILKNFDGWDFMLWPVISTLIVYGVNFLEQKNKIIFNYFSLIFVVFSVPEILRGIIR